MHVVTFATTLLVAVWSVMNAVGVEGLTPTTQPTTPTLTTEVPTAKGPITTDTTITIRTTITTTIAASTTFTTFTTFTKRPSVTDTPRKTWTKNATWSGPTDRHTRTTGPTVRPIRTVSLKPFRSWTRLNPLSAPTLDATLEGAAAATATATATTTTTVTVTVQETTESTLGLAIPTAVVKRRQVDGMTILPVPTVNSDSAMETATETGTVPSTPTEWPVNPLPLFRRVVRRGRAQWAPFLFKRQFESGLTQEASSSADLSAPTASAALAPTHVVVPGVVEANPETSAEVETTEIEVTETAEATETATAENVAAATITSSEVAVETLGPVIIPTATSTETATASETATIAVLPPIGPVFPPIPVIPSTSSSKAAPASTHAVAPGLAPAPGLKKRQLLSLIHEPATETATETATATATAPTLPPLQTPGFLARRQLQPNLLPFPIESVASETETASATSAVAAAPTLGMMKRRMWWDLLMA
ncbi:hypothetical protein HK104_011518 [Borealophlyctis nickersoniae]|nr:hypothetical protein HK104_011518 [Borealophlyctis nickersoniae]